MAEGQLDRQITPSTPDEQVNSQDQYNIYTEMAEINRRYNLGDVAKAVYRSMKRFPGNFAKDVRYAVERPSDIPRMLFDAVRTRIFWVNAFKIGAFTSSPFAVTAVAADNNVQEDAQQKMKTYEEELAGMNLISGTNSQEGKIVGSEEIVLQEKTDGSTVLENFLSGVIPREDIPQFIEQQGGIAPANGAYLNVISGIIDVFQGPLARGEKVVLIGEDVQKHIIDPYEAIARQLPGKDNAGLVRMFFVTAKDGKGGNEDFRPRDPAAMRAEFQIVDGRLIIRGDHYSVTAKENAEARHITSDVFSDVNSEMIFDISPDGLKLINVESAIETIENQLIYVNIDQNGSLRYLMGDIEEGAVYSREGNNLPDILEYLEGQETLTIDTFIPDIREDSEIITFLGQTYPLPLDDYGGLLVPANFTSNDGDPS